MTFTSDSAPERELKPRAYPLRLNQPDFWNAPNPDTEERLLERWRQQDLPSLLARQRPAAAPFWLLDGPPYANGEAHLGHLLNKTLKDAAVRFAALKGLRPVWRAGWDCHGLPLELAVEKRRGPEAKKEPLAFMAECRAEASLWQNAQAKDMSRLGVSANFKQPWLTMDPSREAASLGLLRELWESGALVERRSPTHWCPACQSALAASELEKGPSSPRLEALFLAPLSEDSARLAMDLFNGPLEQSVFVMSWTTTPWTLWANAGFGYPRQGDAALTRLADGRFALLSETALASLRLSEPALFDPEFETLTSPFSRLEALALRARNPLSGLDSPLVPAPFATATEGSGFVHLAPAFGPEDFELGESAGLRAVCHVGPDGRLSGGELPERLKGLGLPAASEQSSAMLKELGLWLASPSSRAETQLCWRHKAPVFYRASRQWALDLDKPLASCPEGLRSRALAALEQVVFLPDARARPELASMLQSRRFWTLSRDRLWGLPLPFYRDSSGALHPRTSELWREAEAAALSGGVEAVERLAPPEGYVKERQTADVWFDSGAALFSANEHGLAQADLGVEGRDQTRGWFLSSFLLAAFKSPLPPFKALLTHGFVVDQNGRKLAKSKGGAPDHRLLFKQAGADALRLWALSQTVGDEVSWSVKSFNQAQRELKDWRVFFRFLLANQGPPADQAPSRLRPLDQLALTKFGQALTQWQEAMEQGRYNHALTALARFRQWASAEWFELSKRLLYCAGEESEDLASARWSMRETLASVLQALSPFAPFSCEEAYLREPRSDADSVFLAPLRPWPFSANESSKSVQASLEWRRSLMPLVEQARELAPKGEPVSLSLQSSPAGLDPQELADFFPGLYTRVEKEPSLLAGYRESANRQARAGASSLALWRCDRCRSYFGPADQRSEAGLCERCLLEAAAFERAS